MIPPSRTPLPVLITAALAENWPQARLRELLAEAGGVIHGLEAEVRRLGAEAERLEAEAQQLRAEVRRHEGWGLLDL